MEHETQNLKGEEFKKEPVFLPSSERKISKKVLIPVLVFLVLTIIFCCGFFYVQNQINVPLNREEVREREFAIEKGESLNKIAKNLEKQRLIKNHLYFTFYVWKNDWSDRLQAGDYLLSGSMNIPRIAEKFIEGDVISKEIMITIPEGFRVSQIEDKLKKNNFQFFRTEAGSRPGGTIHNFQIKDFKEKYDFLADSPAEANLEGFLFPDTYKFYPETIAEDMVKKMLDNFDRKLISDLREEILRQGKTIYDIIIMASLLEKEVKTFEDRQIVSGIFWKRLKERRPIESCATIAYILNVDKWRYSIEDTRQPSFYNTYLNLGLPLGPICNPGIESIRAAVFPKESPYNFFLTDPETGNTVFSKTLQEHNINKAKYF